MCQFIPSFAYPLTHRYFRPNARPTGPPSICPSSHTYVRPSVHPSIHPSIHSFIPPPPIHSCSSVSFICSKFFIFVSQFLFIFLLPSSLLFGLACLYVYFFPSLYIPTSYSSVLSITVSTHSYSSSSSITAT
jgi:hypothetical protein